MSVLSNRITKKSEQARSVNKSMQTFFVVWIGQAVSLLGSSMTGFAMGVWIFQQTGSAASFSITLLLNMLPKAIISPMAGVLADRFERRKIMILTDLSAGIATILAVILFASGNLSIWHIYLLTAVNATASAFQGPAFGERHASIRRKYWTDRCASISRSIDRCLWINEHSYPRYRYLSVCSLNSIDCSIPRATAT
jgi:sugar phosphate permease